MQWPGGWDVITIATLQDGQPITMRCPTSTTAGTNCNDVNVPGQSQKLDCTRIRMEY